MRPIRSLPPLALLFAFAAPAAAQPRAEAGAAVDRAIERLDDDDYFRREEASQQLVALGADAVPALVDAAEGDSLEVTFRAVAALRELSLSDDRGAADAAGAALEVLAASPVTSAARRAALALKVHEQKRSERALEDIRAAGGLVVFRDEDELSTYAYVPYVMVNRAWSMGDDLSDFRLLRGMTSLRFHGADIGDEALAHLESLEYLERVELYGTRVTPEGAAALQSALPQTVVEWRAGALLGVVAYAGRQPCMVMKVQEGSGAEAAGIEIGDIITSFDGREITDFDSLTVLIATKQGGEEVAIEYLRGATAFQRTVTLGRWE